MFRQVIAHVLPLIKLVYPRIRIIQYFLVGSLLLFRNLPIRILLFRSDKERANHLLLSDKEMGTMVVKRHHGWEFSSFLILSRKQQSIFCFRVLSIFCVRVLSVFRIRNQEISRNSGIGVDIEGNFLRFISVSLFLAQYFHIPSRSRFRRRHHAFEDLSLCRLLPLLEVLNRTVSPSHRIRQFLLQRFYIGRNLSLPFILLPLLKLRLRRDLCKRHRCFCKRHRGLSKRHRRLQQCNNTICDNPFHSIFLFIIC